MRRGLALGLLLAWLLGIATGLLGVAITGGWYEYKFASSSQALVRAVNEEGWHIVPGQSEQAYLRRPRLRLP